MLSVVSGSSASNGKLMAPSIAIKHGSLRRAITNKRALSIQRHSVQSSNPLLFTLSYPFLPLTTGQSVDLTFAMHSCMVNCPKKVTYLSHSGLSVSFFHICLPTPHPSTASSKPHAHGFKDSIPSLSNLAFMATKQIALYLSTPPKVPPSSFPYMLMISWLLKMHPMLFTHSFSGLVGNLHLTISVLSTSFLALRRFVIQRVLSCHSENTFLTYFIAPTWRGRSQFKLLSLTHWSSQKVVVNLYRIRTSIVALLEHSSMPHSLVRNLPSPSTKSANLCTCQLMNIGRVWNAYYDMSNTRYLSVCSSPSPRL